VRAMAQQYNSIYGYSAPGRGPVGGPLPTMPPGYSGSYPSAYNRPAMQGSTGAALYGNPMYYTPEQRLAVGGAWASQGTSAGVAPGVAPGGVPMVRPMQPQPQQQQQQQYGANTLSSVLTPEMREKMEDPVEPYDTHEDREMNETMSDLYAAMKGMEYLEKGYSAGHMQYHEYNKQCIILIQQIKNILEVMKATIQQAVGLFKNMGIKFDRAGARMLAGKPADAPQSAGNFAKMASNITAMMLTLIDYIELNYRSVNELGVKVRELEAALLGAKEYLPKSFNFVSVVTKWVKRFDQWGPTYNLTDEQINEFRYDLQTGMTDFQKVL